SNLSPARFAGALRYTTAPVTLASYSCRYASVDPLYGGTLATAPALAVTHPSAADPLRPSTVTCPPLLWTLAEGQAALTVHDEQGFELQYAGAGGVDLRSTFAAPLVNISSQWDAFGSSEEDAWGGDALNVSGAGFDEAEDRTGYWCVFSSVMRRGAMRTRAVSKGHAALVELTVERGDNSSVSFYPMGPAPLLNLTEGWAFPEPSRAPTRGGTVVRVRAFGMEEEDEGQYQCVFSRDGTYGMPDELRA
ncbi:hypothetical protein T484DRAFT_1819001, partial [Baffinella frigidus]